MSIVTAIQQRLIDAGLIGAAKTDLDSNPAYFACCFAPDQPEIYADDPDALLLAAIGADAEEIMGPEWRLVPSQIDIGDVFNVYSATNGIKPFSQVSRKPVVCLHKEKSGVLMDSGIKNGLKTLCFGSLDIHFYDIGSFRKRP